MKIKSKKTLNLPQLIEWLLKSGYRNYTANSNMGNIVTLSRYGAIQFSLGTFFPEETFTVEVEEEITEDTVIPELVMYCKSYYSDSELINGIYKNKNINSFVNHSTSLAPISFYILNDDLTMTLIWRDGKLVE